MCTEQYTRREDCGQQGEKRLKTKKKSSNCWKQSGSHLRWLLSTAEATKGAQIASTEKNHLPDQATKIAAEELRSPGVPKQTTKLFLVPELPPNLNYTKKEEQWTKDEKGIKDKGGWWKLPDQRLWSVQ
jgi:hypothetical protein